MATIRSSLAMYDGMTGPLRSIHKALNIVLNSFEAVQTASGNVIDVSAIQDAREELARASAQMDTLEQNIRGAEEAQDRFNGSVREGAGAADRLAGKFDRLKGAVAALGIGTGIKKLAGLADEVTGTRARLSLIADDGGSVGDLERKLDRLNQTSAVTVSAVDDGTIAGMTDRLSNLERDRTAAVTVTDRGTAGALKTQFQELSEATVSREVVFTAADNGTVSRLDQQIRNLPGEKAMAFTVTDNGSIAALDTQVNGLTRKTDVVVEVTANVNDNNSVKILEQKIMASAQRSRAAYLDTANAIASMGANAGAAFATNDELIAFMEQVNKQFVIGGASAQGQAAAMLQLTQAMAAGALRGEELNSILENAPGIARAIESYMGAAEGSIKGYAEEGLITADVVKNAMFAAADETNAKFESMPKTWAQIWTGMQNRALVILDPLLTKINEIANSQQVQETVDGLMNSLALVADAAMPALDLVANGLAIIFEGINQVIEGAYNVYTVFSAWEWFQNLLNGIQTAAFFVISAIQSLSTAACGAANAIISNWSWIEPIIYGIAGAILFYKTCTLVASAATAAWTTVQNLFNSSILRCPIFWIVAGVIALISAITAVIRATNTFGSQSVSVLGTVCGMVNVVKQFFVNLGLATANVAFGIANAFGACCENFNTAFRNAITSVKGWFYGLLSTALRVVEGICAALNKLPFVEFDYSGIAAKADEYANKSAAAYGDVKEYASVADAFGKGFNTFDAFQDNWAKDAFDSGAAWADGLMEKFGGTLDGLFEDNSLQNNFPFDDSYSSLLQPPPASPFDPSQLDHIGANTGDTAANTAAAADTLDYLDEDLAWMKDIAEREAINRFTTAEITVDMSGMQNTIGSDMDLDGIIDGMIDGVNEAVEIAAEGVHA